MMEARPESIYLKPWSSFYVKPHDPHGPIHDLFEYVSAEWKIATKSDSVTYFSMPTTKFQSEFWRKSEQIFTRWWNMENETGNQKGFFCIWT